MVESVKIFVNSFVEIVVKIFVKIVNIGVDIVVKIDNMVIIVKIASPSAPIVLIFDIYHVDSRSYAE